MPFLMPSISHINATPILPVHSISPKSAYADVLARKSQRRSRVQ